MKRILAPTAALALLLAGCGSAAEAEAPSVPPAAPTETAADQVAETSPPEVEPADPSEDAPTPDAPETSKRGNLVKEVGEGGGLLSADGDQLVSLVINSITVDAPCTGQFAEPAENGHFVVLDASVETSPELVEEYYSSDFTFTNGWKAIAPNGTTSNADPRSFAAYSCLEEAEILPDFIGPGEQATGKIVLDVQNSAGILVWQDVMSEGGLEWEYPAE